jgi:hypothetical protein
MKIKKEYFCFLDETGLLNRKEDRFFALGIIKCRSPQNLYLKIKKLKDRVHFYDEIKWNKVGKKNYPVMKQIIKSFIETRGFYFDCVILDKRNMDFKTHFQENFWNVYEYFTRLLIKGNIGKEERICLLADYYPCPDKTNFELNIKKKINKDFSRAAVFGVCRIDSKGSEILQITDLIMGAILYEFKIKEGLISKPSKYKQNLLKYLKGVSQVKSFYPEFRSNKFNIMNFHHNKK